MASLFKLGSGMVLLVNLPDGRRIMLRDVAVQTPQDFLKHVFQCMSSDQASRVSQIEVFDDVFSVGGAGHGEDIVDDGRVLKGSYQVMWKSGALLPLRWKSGTTVDWSEVFDRKRHFEIRVLCGDVHNMNITSSAGAATVLSARPTLRSRIVEVVRQNVLREIEKGFISDADLVTICAEIVSQLTQDKGFSVSDVSDPTLGSVPLSVEDRATIERMVQGRFRPILTAEIPDGAPDRARRPVVSSGSPRSKPTTLVVRSIQPTVFVAGGPSSPSQSTVTALSPRSPAPSVASATSPARSQLEFDSTAGVMHREVTKTEMPEAVHVDHSIHVHTQPETSTFRYVVYSNATTERHLPNLLFTSPPMIDAADSVSAASSTSTLRVSLTTSPLWEDTEDIIVTAHVATRSSVTLCWSLGYGPRRLSIDLDALFQRRCLTTFQISETALILTVRKGTLVPQWDYTFQISVTSDITGYTARAQATLRVRRPSHHRHTPPAAVRTGLSLPTDFPDSSAFTTSGTGGTIPRHLRGYEADEDAGGTTHSRLTSKPQYPHAQRYPLRDGAAPSHAPVAVSEGTGPSGSLPAVPMGARIGMTFQEQLRHFLEDEALPIYRLSASPNVPYDIFASAIWDCERAVIGARTPQSMDGPLTDDERRYILQTVKEAMQKYQQASSTSLLPPPSAAGWFSDASTEGSVTPASYRPQFKTTVAGK